MNPTVLADPAVRLLLGFILLAAAPFIGRGRRAALGEAAVVLGVVLEALAASSGMNALAGKLAVAHLAWFAITVVWFQIKCARVAVPGGEKPVHHCDPKLVMSAGNQHFRNKKTTKAFFNYAPWYNAFLATSVDIEVTDSHLIARAYCSGGYLWAGFVPSVSEARFRYEATIVCLELNGRCTTKMIPSGSDRDESTPVQIRMIFNWTDRSNEVSCTPFFISGVDGDPISVSPAIPGGGWLTLSIGNAKISDEANLGSFVWMCPNPGDKYTTVIQPDQPRRAIWDPVELNKAIDGWLPKTPP